MLHCASVGQRPGDEKAEVVGTTLKCLSSLVSREGKLA